MMSKVASKRQWRILATPHGFAETDWKKPVRLCADRFLEAVLLDCDFVVEVRAMVLETLPHSADVLLAFTGYGATEMAQVSLSDLGATTRFSESAERISGTTIFLPFKRQIRKFARRIPHLLISFGKFGPKLTADPWHDERFVAEVGKRLGKAIVELADRNNFETVGLGFLHDYASMWMLSYQSELPYRLLCSEKYGCSLVKHEADFLKALIRGIFTAERRDGAAA